MKYIKKFEKSSKDEIKLNDLVHDKYEILAKKTEIGIVMSIMESKIKVWI